MAIPRTIASRRRSRVPTHRPRPRGRPAGGWAEPDLGGRPQLRRTLSRLRRQGFGISPRFARDLRRAGQWIDAATFRPDFRRAPHYRLRAPGNVRVAMIRGRGFLYWWPWWMGIGPVLVGIVDPSELPPLDAVDPSADPDEEPDEELEVLLPTVPAPPTPIPRIRIGEIKGLPSYGRGLRQLAARDPGGGNTAMIVYDSTGKAHLQVFEPGPTGYRITWEGTIGQPRRLPPYPPGTAPFGNWMERWIRRTLQLRTGQRFQQKRPNASGPDLRSVP